MKLKSIKDILQGRMVKRDVPLKALTFNKPEDAAAGTVRQKVDIQAGIKIEKLKEMVKQIKSAKLKVQATIMEDQLRITGAKKDDLQTAQQTLKENNPDIHVEFANCR